ncbi:MAG: DivIVA domain-containing protein, partial [Acidimicrobiales bacterium]
MAEPRSPHVSVDSLSADLIAQRGFSVSRRGFDAGEVREFLGRVAGEVRELRERLEWATEARRDAEERALHPRFDEETLLGAVGEETANILRSARSAAADIHTRAEERAAAVLGEAGEVLGRRVAEAETAAAAVTSAAQEGAEAVRAAARQDAEGVRQQADQERRMTVEAAQSIREKILADLNRRRRMANVQIEQLRAGRERLLDAYMVVRRTLEQVTDELQRADGEARAAADVVGRRAAGPDGDAEFGPGRVTAEVAVVPVPPAGEGAGPLDDLAPRPSAEPAP